MELLTFFEGSDFSSEVWEVECSCREMLVSSEASGTLEGHPVYHGTAAG